VTVPVPRPGRINKSNMENVNYKILCPLRVLKIERKQQEKMKIKKKNTKKQIMYIYFLFCFVNFCEPKPGKKSNVKNIIYKLMCPLEFKISRKQ